MEWLYLLWVSSSSFGVCNRKLTFTRKSNSSISHSLNSLRLQSNSINIHNLRTKIFWKWSSLFSIKQTALPPYCIENNIKLKGIGWHSVYSPWFFLQSTLRLLTLHGANPFWQSFRSKSHTLPTDPRLFSWNLSLENITKRKQHYKHNVFMGRNETLGILREQQQTAEEKNGRVNRRNWLQSKPYT